MIKNNLREEYQREKYKWFPRTDTEENRMYDKRKPGLFRVEYEGDGMVAFCSKSYYVWNSNNKDKFSCKGVQKKRDPLVREQYIRCLNTCEYELSTNIGFRMDKQLMKTYEQRKIALTPIYGKGVVLGNGINIAPLNI